MGHRLQPCQEVERSNSMARVSKRQVHLRPSSGLIEVSVLCDRLNPFTCNDATKYVFWDSYHPTERAYKTIIGEIFQGYVDSFF